MLVALGHAVVLAVAAAGILWKGLSGYYLAYAAVGLVFVTVVSRMTARMPRGVSPPADGPRFPLALPREMWRFSAALLSLTFVTPYAALFVHYRVLRDYGAGTAGWMQAAIGIGLAVRGVLGSAHPVFLTPNVNREGGPADRFAWANAFQATFCFLAGVVLPPLLLFPQIAVRLLYSQAFLPGAAFVSVFVLTEVVILLTGTYQAIVIALDELRFHVAQNVVAQLLMIAVAAWLVTPLGILGAGLAVLAGPLCMYVATTTFLRRRYRLRVPGRLVALSGLLVAGVVASGLVGAHWPEFTLRVIGLKAGVYLAVVGLFSLLLSPDERTRVRGMLAGVRSRLLPAAT
jgi:O-antigen/teichoic acid export membrane protein